MSNNYNKLDCILLIDNDDATNFYHTIVLEEENTGVHIQAVKSAEEGLDFLLGKGVFKNSPRPGLIFLDLNMPGKNGWDFLIEYDELSKEIQDRAVVTILSTSINPDDREKAAAFPAVKEFASKPLTPEMFWKVAKENFSLR